MQDATNGYKICRCPCRCITDCKAIPNESLNLMDLEKDFKVPHEGIMAKLDISPKELNSLKKGMVKARIIDNVHFTDKYGIILVNPEKGYYRECKSNSV